MNNQSNSVYSQNKINQNELMELKKTYCINSNNSIFKKAYFKYQVLFISIAFIDMLLLGFIIIIFGPYFSYGGIVLYIIYMLIIVFFMFYFVRYRLNIVLKFCRCLNCGSKLYYRYNIKKYRYYHLWAGGNIKKDVDIFFDCPKCNCKVYEEINNV